MHRWLKSVHFYNIIWLEIKLKFMNFVKTQNRYYNGSGIYIIFVIDHAETTACLGGVLYIFQTISVNKIYFFKIIRCLVRICNHICVCNVYGKGAVYSSY